MNRKDASAAREEAASRFLLSAAGPALGVASGRKVAAGCLQEDRAIVFYVKKKLPIEEVPRKHRIPRRIAGIPTDVVETGPVLCLGDSSPKCAARFRPAPGGVSVGHPLSRAGTLGCLVKRGKSRFALCAGHIAANANDAAPGDSLLQPAPADGGSGRDAIGKLAEFLQLDFSGNPNLADAAIVRVGRNKAAAEIVGIGALRGLADPETDSVVLKHGRTTALTRGVITATEADLWVEFPGRGPALFRKAVAITGLPPTVPFSQPGDSGAIVVAASGGWACAMLFACAEESDLTFAAPLAIALDLLNVELAC